MFRKMLIAATALAMPAMAHAQAFQNGGFEAGVAPGGFTNLGTGSTAITGWTVDSGSVDYIGSYWQSAEGDRNVDLSGGSAGSISQTFDTVLGQTYDVSFWLAGNPDGGPTVKTLLVSATGNGTTTYTFDSTGATHAAMGWIQQTYRFVAGGTSTTLTFASASQSAYGPALDGVSVTAVPEPAAWGMMIGGFGLAGMAMRRRTTVRLANA